MNSLDVRTKLVDTLRLDLVGPDNGHAFATELLPERPSRWYLTGFLVPTEAGAAAKEDPTAQEELALEPGDGAAGDDNGKADGVSGARRSRLPSSLGLSALVPAAAQQLEARITWGDYKPEEGGEHAVAVKGKELPWRRNPCDAVVAFDVPADGTPRDFAVPGSDGLKLTVVARPAGGALPAGTQALSVFLVNQRKPEPDRDLQDVAYAFQAGFTLACSSGFVPRPDPRAMDGKADWEEQVAELHYRDVCEFAVGHGVAAEAQIDEDKGGGVCPAVRTVWMPAATVERVEPAEIADVVLGMEALAAAGGFEALRKGLEPLPVGYRNWLASQKTAAVGLSPERRAHALDLLNDAGRTADRIAEGIAALADDRVREAFQIANRAVARSMRQRFAQQKGGDPAAVDAPGWRPFQLAFILQTLPGLVDPSKADREIVDLLFFPTGGGKTEAYLGLAATAIVLRRLLNRDVQGKPTVRGCGVSVLMRYTLRLLTLDQLGRAAGLVCALELERKAAPDRLGDWPFEIGLWVGSAATPNTMGGSGDKGPGRRFSAYARWQAFRNGNAPSPIPLEECPWCGTPFKPESFDLVPNRRKPQDLRIHCTNHLCAFTGDDPLPIVAVDEPLYARLPAFLIATVDKFAALPWTGRTGALFGKVGRFDKNGFYGACDTSLGQPLPGGGQLAPPDLVIQDELHLISGPLGTIAGLYETAFDALCAQEKDGRKIRPKIIASTATVRRADQQIRALFGRSRVDVFPPPGIDRNDTFFARTIPAHETPGRLYLGIAAQGRSLKVVMLRASLALLSAAQRAWNQAGGDPQKNPADPYMTLLGYFNALRELGGSRRIYEDEVSNRLRTFAMRRRLDPADDLFVDREIEYDMLELTSRVGTDKVSMAKRRLARNFGEKDRVDVALATNMVSVGVDIPRLGLMVVLGQPKTSAEYIQATSRVGRLKSGPGLIVTLLNIHKSRDRSHYERFGAYHATFYRNVEASSVTPFASRALDRALAGTLISLVRHGWSGMTAPAGAQAILTQRAALASAVECMVRRAAAYRVDLSKSESDELAAYLRHRCDELLDDWLATAKEAQDENSAIQYCRELPAPPRHLLHDVMATGLGPRERRFRAGRSMRDVEPAVAIGIENLRS